MKSAPEKSAAEVEERMFHMKQWANYPIYEDFLIFLE